MQVLAPRDGRVALINIKDGDKVTKGSVIVQMDTTETDLTLARLGAIDALRAIFAKRLAAPALDLTRRISQIAIDIAQIQQTEIAAASAKANMVAAGIGPGKMDAADYKVAADVAPLDRESAEQNKALFEYLINEATAVNELVAAQIQKELAAAGALRASLSLKALTDGTVHLKVQAGWFVSEGELVFEVT